MAEDSDLEKSESASPRRLEQAREEGQVPHSRELATFISLMVGVVALYVLGRWGGHRLMDIMKTGLSLPRSLAFEPGAMGRMLENLAGDALLTVAPLLIATVVAALVTPFLVGGWVFTSMPVFQPVPDWGCPGWLALWLQALSSARLIGTFCTGK